MPKSLASIWGSLLLLAGGCSSYHPEPLDLDRSSAEFRARRLDPGKPWDLEALTREALRRHPDLEAARARLRAAEAGVAGARALPNPTVAFTPGYNADASSPDSPWILG